MSHTNEDDLSKEEIKELLGKEQFTQKETSEYCQQALDISRATYYRYIYPKLRKHFYPLIIERNWKGQVTGASIVKISKERVDKVIALQKKRVEDRA